MEDKVLKWCRIRRRPTEGYVVWDGKMIGVGKPEVIVDVESKDVLRLPKPEFRPKMVTTTKKDNV